MFSYLFICVKQDAFVALSSEEDIADAKERGTSFLSGNLLTKIFPHEILITGVPTPKRSGEADSLLRSSV